MNKAADRTPSHQEMIKINGENLRFIRHLANMTQTELGNLMNLRFQQIQKYESGNNQMSAYRIWQIAQIFKIPLLILFDKHYINKMHQLHGKNLFIPKGKSLPENHLNIYKLEEEITEHVDAALFQSKEITNHDKNN